MFTIDQVTAVEAFFRVAGFDGQLRVAQVNRRDEVTFVFDIESLIPLRRRCGSDLEHVVQQILGIAVSIVPEGEPSRSEHDFAVGIAAPDAALPARELGHVPTNGPLVDTSLSLDEGFRAAYFMIDGYLGLETDPDNGLVLLRQYMLSDPARWSDWIESVAKALADPTAASEYLHDWRFKFAPPELFEGP